MVPNTPMKSTFFYQKSFLSDISKRFLIRMLLFCTLLFSINLNAQTATEDFNSPADVFGGNFSGTNWLNDSWVRSGNNGHVNDVAVLDPGDLELDLNGFLLQLDDRDAGVDRIIDLSNVAFAILSFDLSLIHI